MMPHYREAAAQGFPVAALDERPRLPQSLEYVAAAARDLAGDRTPAGFPFLAVCAWADRVGADPFALAAQLRAIDEASADE